MAPPVPPQKAAWHWAECTKPEEVELNHILTAYRMNLNFCNNCRRNVKGNPNCLSGLGEKAWLSESPLLSDNDLLRENDSHVGLKNLGATCYANAFLQVWFHMPEIRNAVFSWNKQSFGVEEDEVYSSPICGIIACLQEVFALLNFSKRRFIDPTILLNCLLLDNTVQQDAQEFSKLFMSKLEELPNSGKSIFHNFVGQYDYVTSCTSCGNKTRSRSEFCELDLNIVNNKKLSSCLEEFLQQEILEGDNQFFCSSCKKKQNAARYIELVQLPSTLNLQLLRFVYDKEKHSKKKISTPLTFPETLDMSPYVKHLKSPTDSLVTTATLGDEYIYDLFAILIHSGQLATSGHYIAVIRDVDKGTTYQFNDEKVIKLDDDLSGYDLDNAIESSLASSTSNCSSSSNNSSANSSSNNNNGNNKAKKSKPNKEMSLVNAYMLVYRKRGAAENICDEMKFEDLPEELKRKIFKHNKELEQDLSLERIKQEKLYQKKDAIKLLYSTIMSCEGCSAELKLDKFEFVPTQNLIEFLQLNEIGPVNKTTDVDKKEDTTTSHPDNDDGDDGDVLLAFSSDKCDGKFYCDHKKLDPDEVVNLKLLPTDIVDNIADQLKLNMRLLCSQVLCKECVVERCRSINAKISLNEDSKKIASLMKPKHYQPYGYLVGKESWRSWRKKAERNLLLDSGDRTFIDMTEDQVNDCTSGSRGIDTVTSDSSNQLFNTDLLCYHNQLDPNEQNWKLVSNEVWQILKKYFPSSPEFSFGAPCCRACEDISHKERIVLDESKQQAAQLKQLLNDLYLNRKRPLLSSLRRQQKQLNELCKSKPTTHFQPPTSSNNNNNNNSAIIDSVATVQNSFNLHRESTINSTVDTNSPQLPGSADPKQVCDISTIEDLFKNGRDPAIQFQTDLNKNELQCQQPHLRCYLVSSMFIDRWKKCYKDASKNEMPSTVCNQLLLCCHDKLLFNPWDCDVVNEVEKQYVLLWPEEWEILKNYVGIDQKIYAEISRENHSDIYSPVSFPELCIECLEERKKEEIQSRYKYEKAKIYVCRLDSCIDGEMVPNVMNLTTPNDNNNYDVEMVEDKNKALGDEKTKKRKLDEDTTYPSEKHARLECRSVVRRSGRRSRSRGEKEIIVSSDMTLRQLHFEIFRHFQVYKTNQVLYMDGRELEGDDCTLEELHIPPEVLIKLEVHEGVDENFAVNAAGAFCLPGPEEGFKGTGLVG